MPDSESDWYRRLHERWTTPDAIIDAVVVRAVGSAPSRRLRIIGGEGNEVWSLTTSTDEDLIVRVSHHGTFAREHWAVEQARQRDVPAPDVLLVDDAVDAGDEQVAVWVHRRIEGDALGTIEPGPELTRLLEEAGELLSRIHSVRTVGTPLVGDVAGRSDDTFVWSQEAAEAARRLGIGESDLRDAASLLASYREARPVPDQLLHGDWLAEHVLVRDGRVVGIIDFEGTPSGDPAYDLAFWDFFAQPPSSTPPAMLAGYGRGLGDLLHSRIDMYRLGHSMRLMSYYAEEGREGWARHCALRFLDALGRLREG